MSITAMKSALSALDSLFNWQVDEQRGNRCVAAITALRTAISEAEKPFCWLYYERGEEMFAPPDGYHPDDAQPLYLAPQPAQPAPKQEPNHSAWNRSIRDSVNALLAQAGYTEDSSARHQLSMMNFDAAPVQAQPVKPLTDKQIDQCMKQAYATVQGRQLEHAFARAIEAAHGIKEQQ